MKVDSVHPSYFVAPPETTRRIQQRFVHYFPPGGKVADLGCGVGVFLRLLKESGRTGVGVDLTDQYVVSLREEGFSAIRQDVFEFLKSHPATFDGVFASHLIEHFPTQDALRLLELMYESLRSGGTLLLITPSYEDIIVSGERFWLDVSHVRPYPLQLLDAVLKHLGMEITDKGHEPSTRVRPKITSPRSFVRYWVAKLRFGKLYDVGDAFIVAKKPQGVVI